MGEDCSKNAKFVVGSMGLGNPIPGEEVGDSQPRLAL